MLGRNHLIANSCSFVLLSSGAVALTKYTGIFSKPIHTMIDTTLNFFNTPQGNIPQIVWYVSGLLLFLLGTLLPDIDSETSILGRFIHIPIGHRTWTHTIWIPIMLFGLSIWYHIIIWLCLGYFLHLFWDSLSYGGICFLYPISKYRTYGSGAKVKQKHIFKFYRTGKTSEYVLIGVIVTSTIMVIILDVIYFGILPGRS